MDTKEKKQEQLRKEKTQRLMKKNFSDWGVDIGEVMNKLQEVADKQQAQETPTPQKEEE